MLAFDIGGTRVKAAVVHRDCVRGLTAASTTGGRTTGEVLDTVERLGSALVREYGPVSRIGVSVRGIVEPSSGVLVDVNEPLACLSGTAPAARLERRFGVPASIDNDARMYAAGEFRHGAGRGHANLVCLTLGTGVGVGVVVDGRLWRGPRGTRGILAGHVTVDVAGARCGCGNIGCLEMLVGARPLADQVRARLAAGTRSSLAPDGIPAEGLDASMIFSAAASGDRFARETVDSFGRALGSGIVTMIHAYDPDVVVLGGGLTRSAAQYLPAVRAWVARHAWTVPPGRVPVRLAELGDAAALVGAAAMADGAIDT